MANKKLTILERLVVLFGGVTQAELETLRNRAFEAGMDAASDGNDEPRVYTADGKALTTGYKQMERTPRDLSSWSQERAIEAAYRLWNTNPLARTLTEIVVDYVIGDGITVTADNEEVQAVLDRFLQDPVNKLIDPDGATGEGMNELARELGLFGELLVLAFVRDGSDKGIAGDGRLRIGTVDPTQIRSVITNPQNKRDILAVRLKDKTGGDNGPIYKVIRVVDQGGKLEGKRDLSAFKEALAKLPKRLSEDAIRKASETTIKPVSGKEWIICENASRKLQMVEANEDPKAKEFKADGECFLFQVNKISTGVRGRPDMLPLIDWLDRFDQLFFDGAEHVALMNMFGWDLKIEGGEENAREPERNLKIQAGKVAKMKPGSVYAHNEHADLSAKNPDLKTQDLETIVRQLRVLVAGGSRMPEHWLGEGGYTNRATAAEMGTPTFRMLTRRQGAVRSMLVEMCQYAIDVAVALGMLDEEVDVLDEDGQPSGKKVPARKAFHVDMPDINPKDTSLAARVFASIAQVAVPLLVSKVLPKKPIVELLAAAAALLGVEIDVEAALGEEEGLSPDTSQGLIDLIKSLAQPEDEPPEAPPNGKPQPVEGPVNGE